MRLGLYRLGVGAVTSVVIAAQRFTRRGDECGGLTLAALVNDSATAQRGWADQQADHQESGKYVHDNRNCMSPVETLQPVQHTLSDTTLAGPNRWTSPYDRTFPCLVDTWYQN